MEMRERLYRSRTNRIFGGVAAGLGDYLNIDPIIVRVLFVGSFFLSGIGILLYIILWIVVPEENVFASFNTSTNQSGQQADDLKTNDIFSQEYYLKKSNNGSLIIGIILIVIGLFLLGVEIFSFLNFSDLFAILTVGVGIGLIYNAIKK